MTAGNAQRQQVSSAIEPVDRSEIELSGFSGAKVLLIREGRAQPFIRKMSGAPAGNARLHAQAIKQKLTASILDGVATTPRILGEGEAGGVYYYDMDYVRGLDGVTFLRTASFSAIGRFVKTLCDILERFSGLKDASQRLSPRALSLAKCEDIFRSLASVEPRAQRSVETLIDIIERADMPAELAVTACHGDMTLENIVVTETGDVVFIDLLDTFLNHWLADIAKLDQDLKAGWYMRKSPPLPLGVIHYVRNGLEGLAGRLAGASADVIPLLVCVHLARILPYATTAAERQFVLDRLDVLITQFHAGDAIRKGASL